MKRNSGIKVLTGVVVGVTALILMNSGHHTTIAKEPVVDPNNLNEAIASQFNDNIRDVAARLQETEKKLASLYAQNKKLREQPQREAGHLELTKEIDALKEQINQLKETRASQQERPSHTTNGESSPGASTENSIKDIDLLLMKHQSNQNEMTYWNKFVTKKKEPKALVTTSTVAEQKSIPYYTIPAGSDLGHTTLLSALIGEVPVEGKLMQPLFPFSAIISRGDLMAANGVPLPPEVSGMKVNGYAIGVGSFLDNISCVRAYVTSALFVFADGHFVTVGKEQMNGSAEMINNDSIGYLTTPFGNPCIKGQYFTNAPRVLTAMVAAGGIQSLGSSLSQWQMSYMAGSDGVSSTPTGSFGKYALGGAVSEGSVKAADWLEKRIQGSFDMVFVPASIRINTSYRPTQMSLHITQTISLDKEQNGRVLDYGHSQQSIHDISLK